MRCPVEVHFTQQTEKNSFFLAPLPIKKELLWLDFFWPPHCWWTQPAEVNSLKKLEWFSSITIRVGWKKQATQTQLSEPSPGKPSKSLQAPINLLRGGLSAIRSRLLKEPNISWIKQRRSKSHKHCRLCRFHWSVTGAFSSPLCKCEDCYLLVIYVFKSLRQLHRKVGRRGVLCSTQSPGGSSAQNNRELCKLGGSVAPSCWD